MRMLFIKLKLWLLSTHCKLWVHDYKYDLKDGNVIRCKRCGQIVYEETYDKWDFLIGHFPERITD